MDRTASPDDSGRGRDYLDVVASRPTIMRKIILVSALPDILAGIGIGVIRGVKGVVIGQILVAVIGYGELFGLYSRSFVENAEKRIEYYAGTR